MATLYENDITAWTSEQALWLRSGRLSQIDVEHVADEIEDINTRYRIDLEHRCSALLAHLALWHRQPGHRCELRRKTIQLQRARIDRMLARVPGLRSAMPDNGFLPDVWLDALIKVVGEDECFDLPDTSPWTMQQVLDQRFFPD